MSYLNLDPDYFEHPKTKRLIGLLGPGAESYPIKLWCFCAKYHPEEGLLKGYSSQEIEGIIGWNGKTNTLIDALVRTGFLRKKYKDYQINDWLEHEGHIAKFKERSRLAAKKRWEKINPVSNATSNAKDEPKQCPVPNLPNRTIPNYNKQSAKLPYPKPSKEENDLLTKYGKIVKGINIFQFIGKIGKSGYPPPPAVIITACESYFKYKESIQDVWAWFNRVVEDETKKYYANLNSQPIEGFKPLGLEGCVKGVK